MVDRTELGSTDEKSGCACCSTASSAAPDVVSGSAITQDVLVSGMTCSHCVSSVTEELAAVDGVDSVSVDLIAGGPSRVTIHSAIPVDSETVKAAIEEAGYTVASAPA
ncbi:cation transporter [Microbacterium sp. KSW4-11]|uniref:Cation transporter n=1 Tax=Microbacterium gawkjiense TaxID=3067309 RepID=A0ABU3GAL1_9MICO|nr:MULTISPECIES: cation transporter [unclassified Microbacterium]MDT3316521.1 cation transporter [Microbacterium sp. KSW4-11]MDT3345109.1 cation transporter [Microbacterium sp. KSW2-22]